MNEKDLVGADSGRSYQYIDKKSHILYYLNCVYKVISLRDTTIKDSSEECDNGHSIDVSDYTTAIFTANIPFYTSFKNKIEISLRTSGADNSIFKIYVYADFPDDLSDYTPHSDTYKFYYNPKTDRFLSYIQSGSPNYLDSVVINKKVYREVFVISDSQWFYDTIYYNPDGILRLIASGNNIDLELAN
jgi:hypothetical protein